MEMSHKVLYIKQFRRNHINGFCRSCKVEHKRPALQDPQGFLFYLTSRDMISYMNVSRAGCPSFHCLSFVLHTSRQRCYTYAIYRDYFDSWLVSAYDFHSRVVENHKLTRSKTRSFVCDSLQRVNKNRISELTMMQFVYYISTEILQQL